MANTVLNEVAVIDEIVGIICERLNLDRISDALICELMKCTENIREAVAQDE